jgi:hypothetical protein
VRVSGPALVEALLRVETVRGLGIKLPTAPVSPSRIAALARFANTVKVSAVARLPVERRTATLVAFIHSLEASAHDDAFDVLSMLLRDLFARAEQADRRARLRTLKDLDQAALTLAEACRMLLRGVGVAGSIGHTRGAFFFVWTLIAIGVTSLLSVVLSVRGLWG